jgi:hypothetical protein
LFRYHRFRYCNLTPSSSPSHSVSSFTLLVVTLVRSSHTMFHLSLCFTLCCCHSVSHSCSFVVSFVAVNIIQ